MADEPAVIVFDFDGTLVHGDSMTRFALEYLLAHGGRLLFVLPFLAAALPLMAFASTRTAGVSLFWWALSYRLPARRLVSALRRFGATTLSRHANAATFAALAAHLTRGETVVIATAAPAVVVRSLLRARGFSGFRVAGTRLSRWAGGLVANPHCIGATKLVELERRFGLTAWNEVYTDSSFDLPLARHARSVTLVEPSARTLARMQRELAVPVRVVRDGPARPVPA